ncbi:hypothetical protein HMPREF9078_00240, partial [Capnocytophaga sp. oral taxon 380 str. F0488]
MCKFVICFRFNYCFSSRKKLIFKYLYTLSIPIFQDSYKLPIS